MRDITEIIVHCADTPAHMDVGVDEIRRWHMAQPPKGNGWADIGYHGVIRRDGTLESGRPMHLPGAHCKNHNAHSLGLCLVGGKGADGKPENNFTPAQFATLARVLRDLLRRWPDAKVYGHRDFDKGKACPCFDAQSWWALAQQVQTEQGQEIWGF